MIGEMALGEHVFVTQDMEPDIFNNGGEIVPNSIICGIVFSPMNIMK